MTLNFNGLTNLRPKYIQICKKSATEFENFRNEVIQEIEHTTFANDILTDPNMNYTKLHEIIAKAKVNCFPVSTVKFNKYRHILTFHPGMAIIS